MRRRRVYVTTIRSARVARLRHRVWDLNRKPTSVNDLLGRRAAADSIPADVLRRKRQHRIDGVQ